jgi:hypothetical protein
MDVLETNKFYLVVFRANRFLTIFVPSTTKCKITYLTLQPINLSLQLTGKTMPICIDIAITLHTVLVVIVIARTMSEG